MKITEMLMQNVGASADLQSKSAVPQTKSSEKFNSFLERADKPLKMDVVKNAPLTNPRFPGGKPVAESGQTTDEAAANSTVKTKADTVDAKNAEVTKSTKSEKEQTGAADSAKEAAVDVNAEIAQKIAEQLGIPVEMVAQILSQLNLQAIDLTVPENLNAFVQKLYNVDTAKELLNVPNIQNVFNELTGIMNDFTQTAVALAGEMSEINAEVRSDVVKPDSREAAPVVKEAVDTANQKPVGAMTADKPVETPVSEVQVQTVPEQSQPQSQGSQTGESGLMGGSQTPNTAVEQTAAKEASFNPNILATAPAEIEAAANKLEAAKSVNTQDVIDQIVQKMKVEVKTDTTEIKITLKPEHLGDVTLKVSTQNGIVTAQFVAENQRVKEIIEAGFNQLRDSLRQQGLDISQLQVSVGKENSEQMERFAQEQEKSGRRIADIISGIADDEQSEAAEVDEYGNNLVDSSVNYRV